MLYASTLEYYRWYFLIVVAIPAILGLGDHHEVIYRY